MKNNCFPISIGLIALISVSFSCSPMTSASETAGLSTPKSNAAQTQGMHPDDTPIGNVTGLNATPAIQTALTLVQNTAAAAYRGGRIVFVSCQSANSLGIGSQCGISIMNADGSNIRQLTYLNDDILPSLSPDGKRVAFMSLRRDQNEEIYVINTDGSNLMRLTTNPGNDGTPSWSPDGSQIIYVSNELSTTGKPNPSYIFSMGADGSNPHALIKSIGVNGYEPRWSPDGGQIIFITGNGYVSYLNVMNADGTHAQIIKTNAARELASPVWSPDGTQIAFISQKTNAVPGEINVIGKDGKNQHSLTAGFQVIFGGLSWSPDGQQILFSMRGDGKSQQGNPQLYIVNSDGSNLHKLASACIYCYNADWGQ